MDVWSTYSFPWFQRLKPWLIFVFDSFIYRRTGKYDIVNRPRTFFHVYLFTATFVSSFLGVHPKVNLINHLPNFFSYTQKRRTVTCRGTAVNADPSRWKSLFTISEICSRKEKQKSVPQNYYHLSTNIYHFRPPQTFSILMSIYGILVHFFLPLLKRNH